MRGGGRTRGRKGDVGQGSPRRSHSSERARRNIFSAPTETSPSQPSIAIRLQRIHARRKVKQPRARTQCRAARHRAAPHATPRPPVVQRTHPGLVRATEPPNHGHSRPPRGTVAGIQHTNVAEARPQDASSSPILLRLALHPHTTSCPAASRSPTSATLPPPRIRSLLGIPHAPHEAVHHTPPPPPPAIAGQDWGRDSVLP
ncbi:hypothetical protein DFH09DRAFT_612932 [Mycena vulgaris]|nr:hypothetical protein DFH09DRAFT_612932 [Mycena vulgaris]